MKQTQRLLEIMARLRDPETGCPWDRQQTFKTIAPYTVEEAYEVADAIERQDLAALQEELGDLLLQVVYHARMAEEAGLFGFEDVAAGVGDKLRLRHPHVFGATQIANAEAQTQDWEARKAHERAAKEQTGVLDGVPAGMPALIRAEKLQKRAARVGFDWGELGPVFAKVREELTELEQELAQQAPKARLEDELGDVLFAVANMARKLGVDPEQALRGTNRKFERRFRHMEVRLAEQGKRPEEVSLEEMDRYWDEAKREGL
ncbi:MAG TPA: nucleoside triphosphate pyrophosphohydrolase [Gammaproteobacteria bacterium]|jgi:ATP diphosphatase|nr:nucleoside triphosphate pyrophosphohydrolase [Gammaproteobacteria bacterium]